MKHYSSKMIGLTLCSSAAVGLMSPVSASSELGSSPGNQIQNEEAEEPSATETPMTSAGAEQSTEAEPTQGPQTASKEGATSFDTLCNNGQGKPDDEKKVKKRSGIFGMADRMAAMTRKIPLVGDFMVDSANNLSQSIACRLYPEEQEQAAAATLEATQGEEIGKKVEWTSTVRENVTGSSTVASKSQLADGTRCLMITDVVFIDGEEARVSKKMCRVPGKPRYSIVQT